MERVDKLVNDILKKWNPLEVPSEIAEDEYSSYVTFIMKYSQNINSIYLCLKKILYFFIVFVLIVVCAKGQNTEYRKSQYPS